jgi:D-alanyl-D-alanine carboxypeptidase (penicillin-binding protein 5/6)
VLERAKLDDVFTAVPYEAQAAESRINLKAGERMSVRDLLRALLLESANDAAATLAVGVSGSQAAFVGEMNARARELGLRHTAYANPIGLDEPGNHSSARDLAKLTRRLRTNAFFRRTVAMRSARLTTGDHARQIENTNDLLGSPPGVNGVKTGHTLDAGYVLVGSATRGRVNVLSVVLGDPGVAAPRCRHARPPALRALPLPRGADRAAGPGGRHRAGQVPRGGPHRARPGARVLKIMRRGERPLATVSAKKVLEGPLPRGAVGGVGDRACPRTGGGPCPARDGPARPQGLAGRARARLHLQTGYARRDVPRRGRGSRPLHRPAPPPAAKDQVPAP